MITLAAVLLSGCGEEHHPTTSARVVSNAAAKTTHVSTARVSATITGYSGRTSGDGAFHGVVDAAHRSADIQLDLAGLAKAGGANPDDFKGEIVFAGDAVFLSTPSITPKLTPGKRWLLLSRQQLEKSTTVASLVTPDLTKPVDFLRGAAGTAEDLGGETVNGTRARRYRTKVDFLRYLKLVPKRLRPALDRAVTAIEAAFNTSTVPVEVWIASDGTVRRVRGKLETNGAKLEYTLELTAVGNAVTIRPPDQALVLDGRKF